VAADNDRLLVGNDTADDAAVYRLSDDCSLIATTDFFTPIVDDAYDFGRIAAANALSDVWAMGGKPTLALAVLGWPVDKLPASVAARVLEGGRAVCAEAGIPMAGGHSINVAEPFFGLAVNGLIRTTDLKRNSTAREGNVLLLTKGIGSGVLSTAGKRGVLSEEGRAVLVETLTRLNNIGEKLGTLKGVTAMTDVTGFGLLGHLLEMARGAGLSAELKYSAIPILPGVAELAAQRVVPDATYRNWNSYSAEVGFGAGVDVMQAFNLLPDPQTNGGLLVAIEEGALSDVQQLLNDEGYGAYTEPIGKFVAKGEKGVLVV
jgi:selenide,water dikinase